MEQKEYDNFQSVEWVDKDWKIKIGKLKETALPLWHAWVIYKDGDYHNELYFNGFGATKKKCIEDVIEDIWKKGIEIKLDDKALMENKHGGI